MGYEEPTVISTLRDIECALERLADEVKSLAAVVASDVIQVQVSETICSSIDGLTTAIYKRGI